MWRYGGGYCVNAKGQLRYWEDVGHHKAEVEEHVLREATPDDLVLMGALKALAAATKLLAEKAKGQA
jgi:hypothetical protein